MQYEYSLLPKIRGQIERTLSEHRLKRYLSPRRATKISLPPVPSTRPRQAAAPAHRRRSSPAQGKPAGRGASLSLCAFTTWPAYLWNIRLCEAFYLPCHVCEVALRNGVHEALKAKYRTEDWHLEHSVMVQLPVRLQSELSSVWYRAKADHGSSATVHHVIVGLSLGFWNSFLSVAYRHILWHGGMRTFTAFPLIPAGETLHAVYGRVEQFRTLRNRIFHHNAIFDKRANCRMAKY